MEEDIDYFRDALSDPNVIVQPSLVETPEEKTYEDLDYLKGYL